MSEQTPAPADAGTPPAAPVAAPAETATPAVPKPAKRKRKLEMDMTEVEKFKALLQSNLSRVLVGEGQSQISQNLAYDIFRESFDSIVEFTSKSDAKRLSLVGIGRFYIKMSPPRKIASKPESKYAKLGNIPHFRWKPSFKYFKFLIQQICNVDVEKLIESGVIEKPAE